MSPPGSNSRFTSTARKGSDTKNPVLRAGSSEGSGPFKIAPMSSQEDRSRPQITRNRSGRFSTRSTDARKPWLDAGNSADTSVEDPNRSDLRRTYSSDEHVLHAPTSPKRSTSLRRICNMPSSPITSQDDKLGPAKSFDDLWEESVHGDSAHALPIQSFLNSKPAAPSLESIASAERTTPAALQDVEEEIARQEEKKGRSTHKSDRIKQPQQHKHQQQRQKEVDTGKFIKKGVQAPPNTPTNPLHQPAEELITGNPDVEVLQTKRANPIQHRRKSATTTPVGKSPNKDNYKDTKTESPTMKPANEYTGKDEAIASLEKQLDRVNFLQKRQFDQLSSLKKMLLASRAKEKEHAKAHEATKTAVEARDAEILDLKQKLEHSQYMLKQARSATVFKATSHSTPLGSGDPASNAALYQELQQQTLRVVELERQLDSNQRRHEMAIKTKEAEYATQIEEKDAKIKELELQVRALETSQEEISGQAENSLAIAESRLRKKMEQHEKMHAEMEEMREQLTAANSSIEHLEEERNYSLAKLAELNDMVASKGGLSNAEQELLDRAAEISSLTSKLNATDGKVQERDGKIFKLEEEIKGISDLVRQLSDAFVSEDEEKRKQQSVLLESAESPAQASSLLLMTMMNMLDVMKSRLVTLQRERDDMNAKAADRGIQLAESHIRVDKLRTELRRMRAERERARTRPGPPVSSQEPRPRHPSQTAAVSGAPRLSAPVKHRASPPLQGNRHNSSGNLKDQLQSASERSNNTAPTGAVTPQRPSRFMNFLKGNLTQEVSPEPDKGSSPEGASPPLIVQS